MCCSDKKYYNCFVFLKSISGPRECMTDVPGTWRVLVSRINVIDGYNGDMFFDSFLSGCVSPFIATGFVLMAHGIA